MRVVSAPPCGSAAAALLAGALLVGTASAGWFGSGSGPAVATLSTSNFDSHLKQNTKTLVKFHAPWCGHCKELAPKFEEAAKQLQGTGVSLAKLDATESKEIAERYGVEQYPQLLWLEDGERTDYGGERTAEDIVEWVKFMIRPTVVEGQEPGKPGKLPNVVLYAPELYEGFLESAKVHRSGGVWYFVKDIGARPRIVFQHKGEDPIEHTSYLQDKDSIDTFFTEHSIPLFGILDGSTFAKYDGKGLVWSLFPMDKKQGIAAIDAEHRPMMMEVAKKFVGKYSVTYTDTEAFREQIDNMLGVKQFPAIVLQPQAGSKLKYVHAGELTAPAIIDFLEKIESGEVAPHVKSEPVPLSNGGAIRVLVGSTLQEEAFQSERDVLVEIYAPWCGSCKALEPEYKKMAQYVRQWELGEYVTIAKIDGTANDIVESMPYSSFPTLFFVAAGSSTPVKYDGERTSKGMWQWIKQHTAKGSEIKERQAKVKANKASKEL